MLTQTYRSPPTNEAVIPTDPAARMVGPGSSPLLAGVRLQPAFFATCLVLGPLLMLVSVYLNPSRTVDSNAGDAVIASRIAAGSSLSPVDFFIYVTELFLLPFGALGMTLLSMRRSPWLGSIGGFLSMTGFIAFVAFGGQEVQTRLMAEMGGGPALGALWDRFNTDPVIAAYLYIFVIGSLIGPMLLGIGLGRTRVIPAWAMWALILRVPIQVAGFVTHIGLSIEFVTFGFLLLANLPIARALLMEPD